jgi:hypothetical protein
MSGEIILPRRRFLVGTMALLAAPVIVRAANIMPVKEIPSHQAWMYDAASARGPCVFFDNKFGILNVGDAVWCGDERLIITAVRA